MVAMLIGSTVRRGAMVVLVVGAMLSAGGARASVRRAGEGDPGDRAAIITTAPKEQSPDTRRALPAGAPTGAIGEVLQYSTRLLGWKSHLADIHRDDAVANEQAAFLGRDLGIATLLRPRASVAFANVFEPVDGKRLHLGVVEIAFRRCADLERTMTAVARVRRDYFNVAALSVFRTLRRGRSFIVVFSESSLEPTVKNLLRSPAREAFAATDCRDGG